MAKFLRSISFYIILVVMLVLIVSLFRHQDTHEVSFTTFSRYLNENKISKIIIEEQQIRGKLVKKERSAEGREFDEFIVVVPSSQVLYSHLGDQLKEQTLYKTPPLEVVMALPSNPLWITLLPTIVIVIIFIVFWFFFMQQSGGGGRVMNFGKSKARLMNEEQKKTNFSDVAGAEEEKEELKEIVDFLKFPKKYVELGARIPKGVLLVGPPGTGKTLLAKAVAGEAGVPFYSISGSDFVEMFVGVGASRVRDLFEQAKKNEPSIVFIDEIDAVGRHRGAGLGGGHDEREQTLNQLLVEMDGFGINAGVIIIAATNRPDILDPALLRPGRFDRQIVVGVPDVTGRGEILEVHSKNKPLGEDVELSTIAKTTAGFTGADLENLMNEAALLAARNNKKTVNMEEISEAMIKVLAGPEKKTRVISDKEKRLTAYHEAGHAVVSHLLPSQDPVHQVSIVPRGRAGGYTLSLPKEDKYYVAKQEMIENIIGLLGGRAAEKLVLDDISSGASNDIERATAIAKKMVTRYGMSDKLGPMAFGSSQEEVFIGKDISQYKNHSEDLQAEIDTEIRKIIDEAYAECQKLLTANIDKLNRVADALLERERLDGDDFLKVFDGSQTAE